MSGFDLSRELERVIDDHGNLEEYEANLNQRFEAGVLNVEARAEEAIASRTQIVVAEARQEVDERRQQLHEAWLEARVRDR
jgi:hypothetical protein